MSATRFITSFGQLLRCAHKRIVNTIKVYMERNNMQVELRRFRRIDIDFIDVGNFEVGIFFTTDMFTKLGSLLSVTCRHCSVQTVCRENRPKRQLGSN